jgi:hypothetical protein
LDLANAKIISHDYFRKLIHVHKYNEKPFEHHFYNLPEGEQQYLDKKFPNIEYSESAKTNRIYIYED